MSCENSKMVEMADGNKIEPYRPGTRIQCKECGAKGTVKKLEYHESGKLSAIPYNIKWDNPPSLFSDSCHGVLVIYATHKAIERVEGGK